MFKRTLISRHYTLLTRHHYKRTFRLGSFFRLNTVSSAFRAEQLSNFVEGSGATPYRVERELSLMPRLAVTVSSLEVGTVIRLGDQHWVCRLQLKWKGDGRE